MLGSKFASRFVILSFFVASAIAALSSAVNAQVTTGTKNSVYAAASTLTWSCSIVDNVDVNNDGTPDSKFTMSAARLVSYQGDVRKRTYNMAGSTVRLEGYITLTGTLKYWAECSLSTTGQASARYAVYFDTNNNGRQDTGEPIASDASAGFALNNGLVMNFLSTFDLDRDGVLSRDDIDVFNVVRSSHAPVADFDGSGAVGDNDLALLLARIPRSGRSNSGGNGR